MQILRNSPYKHRWCRRTAKAPAALRKGALVGYNARADAVGARIFSNRPHTRHGVPEALRHLFLEETRWIPTSLS